MHTAKQSASSLDAGAGMQNDDRRRAVLRTVFVLAMLAAGIYVGFIILSVLK